MVKQRSLTNPFDVRDSRVMVSLGPLSSKKYCTYSCPFCYVHAEFLSYASLSIDETLEWIKNIQEPYDIIYISGDTDSFAPPRTNEGLALLQSLCQIGVDILFTTRYVFNKQQLEKLQNIRESLAQKNCYLIGCTSVAQLTLPHLEPKPIRPPHERLEQLKSFREIGIISVLAMRPFLPVVPISEYLEIVDYVKDFVHVILGEVWYADKAGILETGVFCGPTPQNVEFHEHNMDFDTNEATWKVFEAKQIEQHVRNYCDSFSIPFFMRSRPAIEWIRNNIPTPIG